MDSDPKITISTKIRLKPEQKRILEEAMGHFGRLRPLLLKERYPKDGTCTSRKDLKSAFCAKHGINARHYNSLEAEIDALVLNKRENIKFHFAKLQKSAQSLNRLASHLRSSPPSSLNKRKLAEVERKLRKLRHRSEKVKQRPISPPGVCFGGRGLFLKRQECRSQREIDAWRQAWDEARLKTWYSKGSSDRCHGNQNIQLLPDENGERSILRLTLPPAIIEKLEDCEGLSFPGLKSKPEGELPSRAVIQISGVVFNDHQAERKKRQGLNHASFSELLDFAASKPKDAPKNKASRLPLTYRLQIRGDDLFVHVSLAEKVRDCFLFDRAKREKTLDFGPQVTRENTGALGVDLNDGFLTVAAIDRSGNPIGCERLRHSSPDFKKNRSEELMRSACREIISEAVRLGCPVFAEDLDFEDAKAKLRGHPGKGKRGKRRVLGRIPYALFTEVLKTEARRQGVSLHFVPPAYTSYIGLTKFSLGYGLDHQGTSALVIARRGMNYSERVTTRTARYLPPELSQILEGHETWEGLCLRISRYKLEQLLGVRKAFIEKKRPPKRPNLSFSQRKPAVKLAAIVAFLLLTLISNAVLPEEGKSRVGPRQSFGLRSEQQSWKKVMKINNSDPRCEPRGRDPPGDSFPSGGWRLYGRKIPF